MIVDRGECNLIAFTQKTRSVCKAGRPGLRDNFNEREIE